MHLKLIAVALLAGTSIASAADLPARTYTKAPIAVPMYNWSGFYAGVHAGYGWGNNDSLNINGTTPFPAGAVTSTDVDGVLAGGQVGYNYQFAPSWLVGVEADGSWTNIKGQNSALSTVAANRFQTTNLELNWLAMVTGRLGYVAGPALLYVKGGAAFGGVKGGGVTVNPLTGNSLVSTSAGSETRTGWTVGGGVEWNFASNWSTKVEYNYVDFGTDSVSRNVAYFGGATGPATLFRDATTHFHLVKVGLNYRFGPF